MSRGVLCKLTLIIACAAGVGSSLASPRESCHERRKELHYEIKQAEVAGDAYRKSGLERAISNVERYCVDRSSADDRINAISKAEAEVRRRQNHLSAARQYGDEQVIKKYQTKLERARKALERAINE